VPSVRMTLELPAEVVAMVIRKAPFMTQSHVS
jgi:hypothetical protein